MNVRRLSIVSVIAFGLAAAYAIPAHAQRGRGGSDKNPLPLEGTRTVSFTTDEGSWMSLDVSPDGQAIVFDLLGDLYTVPIGGGAATQPAPDAQRSSPLQNNPSSGQRPSMLRVGT